MIVLKYDIYEPTLIAKHPTGVKCINQVDGMSCRQEEIEGFIVPHHPFNKKYKRYFSPSWWYDQYGLNNHNQNLADILAWYKPNVARTHSYTIEELETLLRRGSANGYHPSFF
jgi:hypothetical protein